MSRTDFLQTPALNYFCSPGEVCVHVCLLNGKIVLKVSKKRNIHNISALNAKEALKIEMLQAFLTCCTQTHTHTLRGQAKPKGLSCFIGSSLQNREFS